MLQESTHKVKQLFKELSDNKLVREMAYYGPEKQMIIALEEGLIKTYPLQLFAKTLAQRLKLASSPEEYNKKNNYFSYDGYMQIDGDKLLLLLYNYNQTNIEALCQICDLCGYYPAKKDTKNYGGLFIQIEPNIIDDVSKYVLPNNKVFYHITYYNLVHKIMRNGLVPRSENKQFNYPDRIYLFKEKCRDYLFANSEVVVWDLFADEIEKLPLVDRQYCILEISAEGLKGRKLYNDDNVPNANAVYVTENIYPNYITVAKVFNAGETKPEKYKNIVKK